MNTDHTRIIELLQALAAHGCEAMIEISKNIFFFRITPSSSYRRATCLYVDSEEDSRYAISMLSAMLSEHTGTD